MGVGDDVDRVHVASLLPRLVKGLVVRKSVTRDPEATPRKPPSSRAGS